MDLEASACRQGSEHVVRLEQDVVIIDKDPLLFTLYTFDEGFLD